MAQPKRLPPELAQPDSTEPETALPADASPPPPPVSGTIPLQFDWSSWYLTDEDDMGESPIHAQIIHEFVELLLVVARERGWHRSQVGSDAFFGWVPAHPLVRISPDLYLLPNTIEPLPSSFQVWRAGHAPPQFALEVVSEEWRKDYDQNPRKYAQLGAEELVIFDPDAAGEPARKRGPRVPLQVFMRNVDGDLERVYAGPGPVWSETLKLLLIVSNLGKGDNVRLRFAYDREGRHWVPTNEEARLRAEREKREAEQARADAEQARADAEQARADAEQARADAEQARAAAEQARAQEALARADAEARVQSLLIELERLKRR